MLSTIVDTALEASIVGSFSDIGSRVRAQIFDWEPIDVDLSGRRALVTGSSSGIGRATAGMLADLGAEVVVTSRSADRAAEAAEAVTEASGSSAVGIELDTSEPDSVQTAAAAAVAGGPLDIVIHNAGALSDRYTSNSRGMERTLASHLVGPYLMTKLLRSDLAPGARVLWMSSGGMYTQALDVDGLEMGEESYRGAVAYAKAKRAQVELVAALGPRWAPEVFLHAAHPGWVDTPGVEAALPGFRTVLRPILRDAEAGADTIVWLAATGEGDGQPGRFWFDRRPRRSAYLPGTGGDAAARDALVDWLDNTIALWG
jgi:NAD(P)-dependent dehydrogenase (short-subunit alcohol dehydrogenase family)